MTRFRKDKGAGAPPPPDAATRVVDPAETDEPAAAPPPSAGTRVDEPAPVQPTRESEGPQSPGPQSPGPQSPAAEAPAFPRPADPEALAAGPEASGPQSPAAAPGAAVDAPPPTGAPLDAPPPTGTPLDAPPAAAARVDAPGPLAAPPPQPGQLVSAAPAAAATACPSCGSPAQAGQEMCIVCGSRIAREPVAADGSRGWRLPLVLAGIALLLVGTAIAFAVVELTSDEEVKKDDVADLSGNPPPANQPPATQPPATTPPTTPNIPPATGETQPDQPQDPPADTPPATPDAPSGGDIAEWPEGRTAYTVVLVSATSRNAADAKAEQAIKRGIDAGVLRSDDFSTLRPGYWVVFAGQYDSSEEATRAADRFAEQGFGGGYPRQVKPK